MKRLIELSHQYRILVLLATVFVAAIGFISLRNLPIDAEPDITPNQVLVLTRVPSLSPLEVEQLISFPVETAMRGLPGITRIQSTSKYGLSYVAIYFKDGMDPYFCRALINERLPQAKESIPSQVGMPEMGPISTGLGEIYQFKVTGSGRTPMELRSILDWDVAPKLRGVPGVVEVNTQGGDLKTYEVEVDSDKLTGYHIPLRRVIEALSKNNANAGGAYLERSEQQSLIRGEGLIVSLSDIENIVVGNSPTGTPILARNIGKVHFAPMVRRGFATQDGKGEIVVGVAMMLIGENSRAVANRVKVGLADIQKTLPEGVRIEQLYDRTDLVNRTIHTVTRNLIEGGILVIAVLLLLLGSFRAGVVVSLAIPLSMLVAFIGMVQANVSGNLMSLGAIDFGLIVDGSVVIIENILRRLHQKRPEEQASEVILAAAQEGRKANLLWSRDHRSGLCPNPDAGRSRGQDVQTDGGNGAVCPTRFACDRANTYARPKLVRAPEESHGEADLAYAEDRSMVSSTPASCTTSPGMDGWNRLRHLRSIADCHSVSWRRVHSLAR